MTPYLRLALFIGFLAVSSPSMAVLDNKGTNFWLGFPNMAYQVPPVAPPNLEVLIASEFNTSGTVAIPGIGFSSPFSVSADSFTTVQVGVSAMMYGSDVTSNLGIQVTSLQNVAVYVMDDATAASEGYMGLPLTALGSSYMVSTFPTDITIGAASVTGTTNTEFMLVGTQNGTTVTINPSASTGTRTAGVPYNITMNQGDTYQLQDSTIPSDLTGTMITATQAVALIVGNGGAYVPNAGVSFANPLVEQMWPINDWGTNFVTMPYATRTGGDTFRFLANTNGTTVNVNGALLTTLTAGQPYQGTLSGPSYITSNNPIYVTQLSNGGSFDGNFEADPAMMSIQPFNTFDTDYAIAMPNSHFTANYENVVVPTSSVGTVILDGAAIPAGSFSPISSSGYSGAQVSVSVGPHFLTGSTPFGVMVYGYGSSDAYAYPGGAGLVVVPTPTPAPRMGCHVLLYYEADPVVGGVGGLPMNNLVSILQAAGALVTTMPVTTSTYNPSGDNWINYDQVWDARFYQTAPAYCPGPDYGDYFNSNWQTTAINYLNTGRNFFIFGENNGLPSRNDSTGNGAFLQSLGVLSGAFDICPGAAGPFNTGNDDSAGASGGVYTLASTLPGNPPFYGDNFGGIPLSLMANPGSSFVHMATNWNHANVDRSIVQGWIGNSQMPGLGSGAGRVLMCWDTTMLQTTDYGVNTNTVNGFFTAVYQWLGGINCMSPTATFTPRPTSTFTITPTKTPTYSPTITNTPTITLTPTITNTPLPTATPTPGLQVWPNPFNPASAVGGVLKAYYLPDNATMTIYTLVGELVVKLPAGNCPPNVPAVAGLNSICWDGKNKNLVRVSSGIYFYVIQSGGKTLLTGKVLAVTGQ